MGLFVSGLHHIHSTICKSHYTRCISTLLATEQTHWHLCLGLVRRWLNWTTSWIRSLLADSELKSNKQKESSLSLSLSLCVWEREFGCAERSFKSHCTVQHIKWSSMLFLHKYSIQVPQTALWSTSILGTKGWHKSVNCNYLNICCQRAIVFNEAES